MATRATNPLERRVVIPLAIGVGVLAIGTIVYIATRDGEPEKKPAAGGLGSGFPMPMPSRPKPARAAVAPEEVDEVDEEPVEKLEEPKPPRAMTESEIRAILKEKADGDSSITITRKFKNGKVLSKKTVKRKDVVYDSFAWNDAGQPYVLRIYSYKSPHGNVFRGVLAGSDALYTSTKKTKVGKSHTSTRDAIKSTLLGYAESRDLGSPG